MEARIDPQLTIKMGIEPLRTLERVGIQKPSATLTEDQIHANQSEQEPPEDCQRPLRLRQPDRRRSVQTRLPRSSISGTNAPEAIANRTWS